MSQELLAVTIAVGAEHRHLAQQAAHRMKQFTGLDVQVLTEAALVQTGCRHPCHLKFRLFDLVDAENILYFDADAFCLRPWNPRQYVNRPEWVAVRGFWFDPRMQRLGWRYGFEAETFNGGFFLCNRRHHQRVLRLAEALQPEDDMFAGLLNWDEIALCTAFSALRVQTLFLDRRYNWLQYGNGNLAEHSDIIIAHACDADLRRKYLLPDFLNIGNTAALHDERLFRELAGKTFTYERMGHDRRPLLFREDGTIGAEGGDAERFYLACRKENASELVIGSVFDETCTLRRQGDGSWYGHWSHHERMPITLSKHRAQVVIDLLAERHGAEGELLGVEVGVFQGETSALLLRALPNLHLCMVDPWRAGHSGDSFMTQTELDNAMAQAVAATEFAAARRTILPGDQLQVSCFVPDMLNFVCLDADRGHGGTHDAIQTWWPKLARGGVLAGHGYSHPDFPGVQPAVDEFAQLHGLRVYVGSDFVWWSERPI